MKESLTKYIFSVHRYFIANILNLLSSFLIILKYNCRKKFDPLKKLNWFYFRSANRCFYFRWKTIDIWLLIDYLCFYCVFVSHFRFFMRFVKKRVCKYIAKHRIRQCFVSLAFVNKWKKCIWRCTSLARIFLSNKKEIKWINANKNECDGTFVIVVRHHWTKSAPKYTIYRFLTGRH